MEIKDNKKRGKHQTTPHYKASIAQKGRDKKQFNKQDANNPASSPPTWSFYYYRTNGLFGWTQGRSLNLGTLLGMGYPGTALSWVQEATGYWCLHFSRSNQALVFNSIRLSSFNRQCVCMLGFSGLKTTKCSSTKMSPETSRNFLRHNLQHGQKSTDLGSCYSSPSPG